MILQLRIDLFIFNSPESVEQLFPYFPDYTSSLFLGFSFFNTAQARI